MSNKGITIGDLEEQVGHIPPHSALIFCGLIIPEFLIGIRRPGEEIQWTPRAEEKLRKLRRDHVMCPVRKVSYDYASGKVFTFTGDDTILLSVGLSTLPHIITPGYQGACWGEHPCVTLQYYHNKTYRRCDDYE